MIYIIDLALAVWFRFGICRSEKALGTIARGILYIDSDYFGKQFMGFSIDHLCTPIDIFAAWFIAQRLQPNKSVGGLPQGSFLGPFY